MAGGKYLAKHSRIHVAGYDVSGDSNAWSVGMAFPEADVSSIASTQAEKFLSIPVVKGDLKLWFNNTTNAGSLDLFKAPATQIVTLALGQLAVPAAGDICVGLDVSQLSFLTEVVLGQAVKASASLSGAGPNTTQVGNIYGVLLHPDSQETGTVNGTTIDNGAATAAGALGFLHVTAAGGTWAIIIQHDTASNMATATTLMTFTSNGTAITAEVQSATGTVKRYTRAVMTRTSGNFNGEISLVRG